MKICAIICEFNPFHNGHAYLINRVKENNAVDSVICIMSGNFTQRGDMAILDKYTRAKHAVLSGADAVLQLPTPFAVAPAPIFAQGALKILSSIPDVKYLAFGCENDNKDLLIKTATAILENEDALNHLISEQQKTGLSYTVRLQNALKQLNIDDTFVTSPNNILALEYTKQIIKNNYNIEIILVKRVGSGYHNEQLDTEYSSASAIRTHIKEDEIYRSTPQYTHDDLKNAIDPTVYQNATKLAFIYADDQQLSKIQGCHEGIENLIKSKIHLPYSLLLKEVTSKRYTTSHVRRLLCANLLKIEEEKTQSYLSSELFIKPLAVKKDTYPKILTSLAQSTFPLLIKQTDLYNMTETAKQCWEQDEFADTIYAMVTNTQPIYNYTLKIY